MKKLLLTMTCLMMALPASAEKSVFYEQVYMSEPAAIKTVFKGLNVSKSILPITTQAKKVIQKRLRRKLKLKKITLFTGSKKGKVVRYGLILDEKGKHYPMTFMVGLNPQARIEQAVVMVYREKRGDAVRRKRFLNQFKNKSSKDPLAINKDIIHLTGSTISSWAMTAGVRKAVILIEELVLKGKT